MTWSSFDRLSTLELVRRRVCARRCRKVPGRTSDEWCAAKRETFVGWRVHLVYRPDGAPVRVPMQPAGVHDLTTPQPFVQGRTEKYVRCTFLAASERHGRQVWNSPLPVRCVGADRIADCALQWQKTYLCSNVLSALKQPLERSGFAGRWSTVAVPPHTWVAPSGSRSS